MQWMPDGWKPKAVAVDIDGTITDYNKKLHLEAIESLRRLEDAGIPVILSTGNVRAIILRALKIYWCKWAYGL